MRIVNNYFFRFFIIFVVYYIAARIGLSLASYEGQVTLIWPPTGLAIFALLFWGKKLWVAIWLAAFMINLGLNTSVLASMAIASGNTLGPVLAVYILRKIKFREAFASARDVILYVFIAAGGGMMVNATIGTTTLWLDGVITLASFLDVWLTWWLGDALGVLIFGSALLTIPRFFRLSQQSNINELILTWASLILVGLLSLSPISPFDKGLPALVTIPFVLWMGLRHNALYSAWTVLILSLITIWGALLNAGPFIDQQQSLQLIPMWLYLFVMAVVSQLITALRTETDNALYQSQLNEQRFLACMEYMPAGLLIKDLNRNILFVNRYLDEIWDAKKWVGKKSEDVLLPAINQQMNEEDKTVLEQGYLSLVKNMPDKNGINRIIHTQKFSIDIGDQSKLLGEIAQDITDKVTAEQAANRFAYVLEQSLNEIYVFDSESLNFIEVNQGAQKNIGYSLDELRQMKLLDIEPELSREKLLEYQQQLKSGKKDKVEFLAIHKRKDSTQYPVEVHLQYIEEEHPIYVAIIIDITERERANELIQYQAKYDDLTDLPNRRQALEYLNKAMARCERHEFYGAVLFVDMDGFKTINDSLGHSTGDKLLQEVAARLQANLRTEDLAARIGGDEFLIVYTEFANNLATASQQAQVKASIILQQLAAPYKIDLHSLKLTASIGIVMIPKENKTPEDIVTFADIAMYKSKELGRNKFSFYQQEMQDIAQQRLNMQNKLSEAIENQQFSLYFQPQVNLVGDVVGAEALIRWNHPEHGIIFPSDFIKIAEDTGQILQIGRWVLIHALENFHAWQDAFLVTPDTTISVNISSMQFHQTNFVAFVQDELIKNNINPHRLILEFTESVFLDETGVVLTNIQELKKTGVRFSIDDFGTGYSSLSYLRRLPIDELKIDRSFINDMTTNTNDENLVETIINLAHNLKLRVIAEGVETEEQLKLLQQKGCQYFQGYYFSKPLNESDFTALLEAEGKK